MIDRSYGAEVTSCLYDFVYEKANVDYIDSFHRQKSINL